MKLFDPRGAASLMGSLPAGGKFNNIFGGGAAA